MAATCQVPSGSTRAGKPRPDRGGRGEQLSSIAAIVEDDARRRVPPAFAIRGEQLLHLRAAIGKRAETGSDIAPDGHTRRAGAASHAQVRIDLDVVAVGAIACVEQISMHALQPSMSERLWAQMFSR